MPMSSFTTRVERLLKQTERMRQKAVKSLLRTLKHIDQERKQRTADLEEAAKVVFKQLAELGHSGVNSAAAATKAAKRTVTTVITRGKKRIRRSPGQLKAEAAKAFAMIRVAGKEGIGGAEIRKSVPGVGPNIRAFVENNGGGKVKTTGRKSQMRYHAA
jgi:hypothetical protein